MPKPPPRLSLNRVVALAPDRFFIVGQPTAHQDLVLRPDERVTWLVEVRDGAWRSVCGLPGIVSSLTASAVGGRATVFAMLRNGVTHSWLGDQHAVEIIDRARGLYFDELREIGGELFACGAAQQVFRRREAGWEPIDEGVFLDAPAMLRRGDRQEAMRATSHALTSLDGRGVNDLWAVGVGGRIWHRGPAGWQAETSPTDLGLLRVRCTGEVIHAVGWHGLLLRRDSEGWRVLHQQRGTPPLTDLAQFAGRLYACSEFGLHVLEGDTLRAVDPGLDGDLDFGALAVSDRQLISVGGQTVLTFDGQRWARVKTPWRARRRR